MIKRQAGLARRRDVEAQAFLLGGGAFGGVVIVEPGLADADHLWMRGEGDQLLDRRHRILGRAHRMGAGGIEHAVMCLGQGAD
jgi:hypothetical protein